MRSVSIMRNALVALAVSAGSAAAQTSTAAQAAPNDHTAYAVAAPASWVGIYRLQFTARDRGLLFVRLLLEREGDNVSGTIVSDEFQSTIYDIQLTGDELRATMPTDEGTGEIVLKNSADGITGTLRVHGKTWTIAGRRTT